MFSLWMLHELYLPMQIAAGKKIFFLSDFHLGSPDHLTSLHREKYIIRFLESIQHEAAEIFILGDIFDFWFEYKTVVPKGYVRILGKLATLTDAGIPIQFFVGNHDMWMKNYFEKELAIPVYYEPKIFLRNGRQIPDRAWRRARSRRRRAINFLKKYSGINSAKVYLAFCHRQSALGSPTISVGKAVLQRSKPMKNLWEKKMSG